MRDQDRIGVIRRRDSQRLPEGFRVTDSKPAITT
jgi:hypothetical protein